VAGTITHGISHQGGVDGGVVAAVAGDDDVADAVGLADADRLQDAAGSNARSLPSRQWSAGRSRSRVGGVLVQAA